MFANETGTSDSLPRLLVYVNNFRTKRIEGISILVQFRDLAIIANFQSNLLRQFLDHFDLIYFTVRRIYPSRSNGTTLGPNNTLAGAQMFRQ